MVTEPSKGHLHVLQRERVIQKLHYIQSCPKLFYLQLNEELEITEGVNFKIYFLVLNNFMLPPILN